MICLFNLVSLIFNILFLEKLLHVYQLKDYNNCRYFSFFKKKYVIFIIFYAILLIFLIFLKNLYILWLFSILVFSCQFVYIKSLIQNKKTPLKYTSRLKHSYLISVVILLGFSFFKFSVIACSILIYFLPPISNCLNLYDKLKNKKFIKQAQKKLKTLQLKIIAITGSNGKTSVKNILYEMLKTNYKVVKTPASFNTPLGIAMCINNDVDETTEILILEYGARRIGDIELLCKTFGADYGILTSISPQHLETFKNVSNIAKAKNELPKFLQNNLCVFNVDSPYSRDLFCKKTGRKIAVSCETKSNTYTSNIKIENGKTNFKFNINNQTFACSTKLLGKHNVMNILLALTIAKEFNITTEKIIEVIENLCPTPHRLELIKTHINILDDSYNCSLSSAKYAIEVLNCFAGKKMIVTPGIIEGGKQEKQLNFELGEMCASCDYVVIVGNHNKENLLLGLQTKNFDTKKILFAQNLEYAKQYFKLLSCGDNLLILNDLPDDYN